jgi:hypothetical protein
MTRSTPPLNPELEELLGAERTAPAPADVLDRVWSRVAHSAVAGIPNRVPAGRNALRWVDTHAQWSALVAFGVGTGVGAFMHAAVQRSPPPQIVYVERPDPHVTSSPTSRALSEFDIPAPAPTGLPPSQAPTLQLAAAPLPPSRVIASPTASPSSLSAERAVLDRARDALAAGDGPGALTWTDDHAIRFSRPQLAEEREAIAIQALVIAGRYDEARGRAARLRAASPNSLFLPAVEASLASIP